MKNKLFLVVLTFAFFFFLVACDTKVEKVSIENAQEELEVAKTLQLSSVVEPNNAKNQEVVWESSNSEIATVDKGLVTALKEGSVVITLKAKEDEKISDSVTIKVITAKILVTSVTINEKNVQVNVNKNVTLTATVLPENATNKEVVWSSSNSEVATVENGLVTGVKVGTAVITCQAKDSEQTATVNITVLQDVLCTEVKINEKVSSLEVGTKLSLTTTVLPENAGNKEVVWSSSDETVATVENGLVTALKEGTVKIIVTSKENASLKDEVELVVFAPVLCTSIEINASKNTLEISETLNLTLTVFPENATNKEVVWSSNDETIATCVNGLVTALKDGVVIITATSKENSSLKDEVEITVVKCSLSVSALRTALPALLKEYLESSQASYKIELTNDDTTLTINYAYELKGESFEKLMHSLTGNTNASYYIKDGVMYMSANGTKAQYELPTDENEIIYTEHGPSAIVEAYTKFYSDSNFYEALSFVSENEKICYNLDITKYNGDVLETLGKDEIKLYVTLNNGVIESVEYVAIENSVVKSIKVSYLGKVCSIDYPTDLETYPNA